MTPPLDPYTDPATGVLRNRLGITDPAELARAEAFWTASRLAQLYHRDGPRIGGTYDLAHRPARVYCHPVRPPGRAQTTLRMSTADLPAAATFGFVCDVNVSTGGIRPGDGVIAILEGCAP